MITLWQWSTPRLTPATSLPSLLVRSSSRPSLSLVVRPHNQVLQLSPQGVVKCWVTICGWLCSSHIKTPRRKPLLMGEGEVLERGIALSRIIILLDNIKVVWSLWGRSCWAGQCVDSHILNTEIPAHCAGLTHLFSHSFISSCPDTCSPLPTGVSWEPVDFSVWWCQRGGPVLPPGCTGSSCRPSTQWVACSSSPGPGYPQQGGSLTEKHL